MLVERAALDLLPTTGPGATGRSDVASGRPRAGATGATGGTAWTRVDVDDEAERGASVTRPGWDTTGRTGLAARGCAWASVAMRAAAAGWTGARFSRMSASFCSKRGGAGGGATRATTGRARIAAGGRGAETAARAETRVDARVGRTGTVP